MSKHTERPGRDLWAGLDLSAPDAIVSNDAPPVIGDRRTNYPAAEKLGASQGMAEEVEAEQKKQSEVFAKMLSGEHTGEDAPTEPVEVEGKATVEKRRKAKEGEA